ncbi:hypothetical protein IMSAG049_00283 [Clostridiales bacterium]|nr:hypothetical protein IMSAG049_00283 [Clostridiales bacterium]
MTMIRYEIKKILSKTGSKIAILCLLALMAVTCFFAANVGYVNESGETEMGVKAVRKLRQAQKEWAGVLDEDKLIRVIEKNRQIAESPEAKSEEIIQNEIAYSRRQDISEIRNLLNNSFSDGFRSFNYYRADSLNAGDARNFYKNRAVLLKEWLDGDEADRFSEAKKKFLIDQYEALETPFYYDYMKGWTQLFEYSTTIIMITMLILGYLVSGIFSDEYRWKSDSVFFSSRYGRDRAVTAKIMSGAIIVTTVYFITMMIYTTFVLTYFGADGTACQIQADRSGWKSFYNLLNWQEYVIIVAGGYIGCLFMSLLTMAVSAKTSSGVFPVTIPFVMIFLPSFVSNFNVLEGLLGLLPDRLLQMNLSLKYFDLYEFGGKVIGAVPILFVLYGIFIIILTPLCYRCYKNKQIL